MFDLRQDVTGHAQAADEGQAAGPLDHLGRHSLVDQPLSVLVPGGTHHRGQRVVDESDRPHRAMDARVDEQRRLEA
jgi:hypothetical protein